MINLQLKKEFQKNEKWPLLYVIADIYCNHSSKEKPLKDSGVVQLAKDEYGLAIERHLIKKYRVYLTEYFGFEFSKLNKGYCLKADSLVNEDIKGYFSPKEIINFDIYDQQEKISIIQAAIKKKRQIRFKLESYIHYVSRYIAKKNKTGRVVIKPKDLIVSPLQLFIFDGLIYLLSFNDEDSQFYINLLDSMIIRRDSMTRHKINEDVSFNLERYIKKQDFIVTGPVDENYSFKFEEGSGDYSYYSDELSININKNKEAKYSSIPSFYQSLMDLYSERIAYFEDGYKDHIEIIMYTDNKTRSFIKRFEQYKEIWVR